MNKKETPKRRTYKDLDDNEKQKLMLFHLMKLDLLFIPLVVAIAGIVLLGFGMGIMLMEFSRESEVENLRLVNENVTVGDLFEYVGQGIAIGICIIFGYILIVASVIIYSKQKDKLKKDFDIDIRNERFKIR